VGLHSSQSSNRRCKGNLSGSGRIDAAILTPAAIRGPDGTLTYPVLDRRRPRCPLARWGHRNHRHRHPVPPRHARGNRPRASRQHGRTSMRALINLLRHLTGLFIDDGSLAIAILCVVVFVALIAFLMPSESLMPGAILSFGCLAILLMNVVRAAQHQRLRQNP
jgi:hypothetical protein